MRLMIRNIVATVVGVSIVALSGSIYIVVSRAASKALVVVPPGLEVEVVFDPLVSAEAPAFQKLPQRLSVFILPMQAATQVDAPRAEAKEGTSAVPVRTVATVAPRVTSSEVLPVVKHTPVASTSPVVKKPGFGQGVFNGAFVAGWYVDSSTAAIRKTATTLTATYSEQWQYLYLRNTSGIDVSESEVLSITARVASQSNVYIVLYDTQSKKLGARRLADFAPDKTSVEGETEFVIPLSQLGADKKIVGGIALEAEGSAVMTIVSVAFANTSGGRSIADLITLKAPQMYDAGLKNGWHIAGDGAVSYVDWPQGVYTKPLGVSFSRAGANLYFENEFGFTPSTYRTLHLVLRGDPRASGLTVTLTDKAGRNLGTLPVKDYMNNAYSRDEFKHVYIPLKDFWAGPDVYIETRTITSVGFSASTPYDIAIDNITFAP